MGILRKCEKIRANFLSWLTAAMFVLSIAMTPADSLGQQARPAKSGIAQKLSTNLIDLGREYEEHLAQPADALKQSFKSRSPTIVADPRYVVIDALPMVSTDELKTQLEAIGAVDIAAYESVVSARVPLGALRELGQLSELRFARPYMAITWAGITTSQGDRSQRSDAARSTHSVTGSGVTVGVLSDT